MEKIINLLGIHPNGVMICRSNSIKDKDKKIIVMESITEQEENRIDNSKTYYGDIRFERDNKIIAQAKDIYLYGELDFNNPEDIHNIELCNLINPNGEWIYSNINYDEGNFTTIDGIPKQFQTSDAIKWFKYCHILIGKPKRIIVYKRDKYIK